MRWMLAAVVLSGCYDFDAASQSYLSNGGFEGDLSGWRGYNSTIEQVDQPRDGASSCQVCFEGSEPANVYNVGDSPNSIREPEAGQGFVARAWLRAPDGADDDLRAELVLREVPVEGEQGPETRSDSILLDDVWREVTVTHTMSSDADSMSFFATGTEGESGRCFLVDDASLYQVVE